MRRWVFTDTDGVLPDWTWPRNPSEMDAPELEEAISAEPTVFAGQYGDLVQPVAAKSWTFKGVLLTLADVDMLEAWLNHGRPILLTDHFGRVWRIQLESVDAVHRAGHAFPERHAYTVTCLMLGSSE